MKKKKGDRNRGESIKNERLLKGRSKVPFGAKGAWRTWLEYSTVQFGPAIEQWWESANKEYSKGGYRVSRREKRERREEETRRKHEQRTREVGREEEWMRRSNVCMKKRT